MRRAITSLLALLLLLGAGVTGAGAQQADPTTPVSSTDSVAAGSAAPVAGVAALPERAAPPRTLRAYGHVFVAFAVTWVLLFGYALSIGRRFGRLDDEVRRLSAPSGPAGG